MKSALPVLFIIACLTVLGWVGYNAAYHLPPKDNPLSITEAWEAWPMNGRRCYFSSYANPPTLGIQYHYIVINYGTLAFIQTISRWPISPKS